MRWLRAAAGVGGSDGERTSVAASFYPLAFAAEQVGGASVDVRNLTPPGQSRTISRRRPATSRSSTTRISSCSSETASSRSSKTPRETATHVLHVLDTPGLDRLEDGDVHVWLDPLRYAVLVKRIADELGRPDRAARLGGRLRSLDRAFAEGLADCERREIVTNHAAFGYLADRYRLEQVAITGGSPEGEPAPRDLERAVEAVRETGATTVFVEPLVSTRVVEAVAREAGVKTAVLNPIEGLTESEQARGADYFSLMRANLATLREALACR